MDQQDRQTRTLVASDISRSAREFRYGSLRRAGPDGSREAVAVVGGGGGLLWVDGLGGVDVGGCGHGFGVVRAW